MRNANDELSITANTLRFFTRSWAPVRLAPDDASSTVSRSILRPLTPPLAFWASTRAWHALSESSKFGAATPVPDQMKPSFTESLVTPWVSRVSLLAAAGAGGDRR